jgi:hypothetical protein
VKAACRWRARRPLLMMESMAAFWLLVLVLVIIGLGASLRKGK